MSGRLRAALDRGVLLAVAVLVLYLALAPTAIVGGDNSEFAALSVLPGRAHPSGYPLYVLWLRATAWLPGATVAHTAAIATCVLGALAVLVLHAACRAWGARPLPATLACAVYATSPVVMIIHTEAEVFALNAVIVATILWLGAPGGPLRGERRVWALALVAGLGLSDHMSCVLVAPVGLYGAVRGVRESRRSAPLVIAGAFVALAAGLLPYLQVALADDSPASWGSGHSFDATLQHFLRSDYGSGQLSARGGDAMPGANLAALARTLARGWWWAPLGVAIVTMGLRAARARPSQGQDPGARAPWIAYAIAWLLAGPLFVSRFNIDPSGFGIHIVQRMHLLPLLLTAIPVAVGLDALGGARLARASALWGVLALPLVAAPSLSAAAAEHTSAVEVSLRNTLEALPPNAAMITDGDDFAFGVPYLQHVRGVRPDVIAINWPTLGYPWELARLAARGVPFDPRATGPNVAEVASVRLADLLLATGHPVFVDDFEANILRARRGYPFVGLHRVLGKDEPAPNLGDVFAANAKAFARFDFSYPPPGPDDGFMTVAHLRYTETWDTIARQYRQAGDAAAAADASARARALSPQE